jgi:chromosome segregation ATPase
MPCAQVEEYQEKIQALLVQIHQEQEAAEQQKEELDGAREAARELRTSIAALEEEKQNLLAAASGLEQQHEAEAAQQAARAAEAEQKLELLTKQHNAAKVQFQKLKKIAEDRKGRVAALERQLQQHAAAEPGAEVEALQASLQQQQEYLDASRSEAADLQQKVRVSSSSRAGRQIVGPRMPSGTANRSIWAYSCPQQRSGCIEHVGGRVSALSWLCCPAATRH